MPRPVSRSMPLSPSKETRSINPETRSGRISALPLCANSTITSNLRPLDRPSKTIWRRIADGFNWCVALIQNFFVACIKAALTFFTKPAGPFKENTETASALLVEHLEKKLVTVEELMHELFRADGKNLLQFTQEERKKLFLAVGKAKQRKEQEKEQEMLEIARKEEEAEALAESEEQKKNHGWWQWTGNILWQGVKIVKKNAQKSAAFSVKGTRRVLGLDRSQPQSDETYIQWGENFLRSYQGSLEEKITEEGFLEVISNAMKEILDDRKKTTEESLPPRNESRELLLSSSPLPSSGRTPNKIKKD